MEWDGSDSVWGPMSVCLPSSRGGLVRSRNRAKPVAVMEGPGMGVSPYCHGLGRCPLLISQDLDRLPFNLGKLRCLPYADDAGGMHT